jgi:hypothetical protein
MWIDSAQKSRPKRGRSFPQWRLNRTVYDALVREGEALHPETAQSPGQRGRGKQSIAANLLRRFRLHADAVLRFISDPAVPSPTTLTSAPCAFPRSNRRCDTKSLTEVIPTSTGRKHLRHRMNLGVALSDVIAQPISLDVAALTRRPTGEH